MANISRHSYIKVESLDSFSNVQEIPLVVRLSLKNCSFWINGP